MQRRTLLRLGIAAGVALTVGAGLLAAVKPGRADGRLTTSGRELYAALAQAILGSLLPIEAGAREAALQAHLARLEAAIAGMPPAVQAEVDELTTIAASAPGRLGLIGLGSRWAEATPTEVSSALQQLRFSSIALRQQVYQAFCELTKAAYFADASTWPALGYKGQRALAPRDPA